MTNQSTLDKLIEIANADKKEKLNRITPKGLRHSHASFLFANNMDLATIAERLGDTIQVVRETYIHFLKSQTAPLKDILNSINF